MLVNDTILIITLMVLAELSQGLFTKAVGFFFMAIFIIHPSEEAFRAKSEAVWEGKIKTNSRSGRKKWSA